MIFRCWRADGWRHDEKVLCKLARPAWRDLAYFTQSAAGLEFAGPRPHLAGFRSHKDSKKLFSIKHLKATARLIYSIHRGVNCKPPTLSNEFKEI